MKGYLEKGLKESISKEKNAKTFIYSNNPTNANTPDIQDQVNKYEKKVPFKRSKISAKFDLIKMKSFNVSTITNSKSVNINQMTNSPQMNINCNDLFKTQSNEIKSGLDNFTVHWIP